MPELIMGMNFIVGVRRVGGSGPGAWEGWGGGQGVAVRRRCKLMPGAIFGGGGGPCFYLLLGGAQ